MLVINFDKEIGREIVTVTNEAKLWKRTLDICIFNWKYKFGSKMPDTNKERKAIKE